MASCAHFAGKGIRILQVLSRSESSCKELAAVLHTGYSTRLEQMKNFAGIIIIAVPDSQIGQVIERADFGNSLVVHTAGSVPMDIFKGSVMHYGVLYPLMTFSRNKPVDFASIPLLIEANSDGNTEKLFQFAGRLSEDVRAVNSEKGKLCTLLRCSPPIFRITCMCLPRTCFPAMASGLTC